MGKEDIVVDGLVATIGANPKAALECFETFSFCKNEMELPTVCGLSNISFGLPERSYVNTAFSRWRSETAYDGDCQSFPELL